ncbi:protein disulfide-isomerase domain [Plasmopara halstedii]|uniref:Sulfhydryl oxidase n=1 Tax=Plasmopara halstedii TaxID=4781 RepID=A0A0P1AEM7_PLAHL|nr:protein disulfide-isomerase domain [Plasmopara halstedii]CEG38808.1 protein disulfide-isomerase domain [Plasmopara halstedii]|eukprot:XP_024575177.1 protein disulfide-isomerase domain [Plasmopara halstedii]
MKRLMVLTSAVVLLALPALVLGSAVNPKEKGEPLFPENHPNITFLTDKNWDQHLNKTDKPWIVDFYHPFCPHCKQFAPLYFDLAAYYKEKGTLYVGAISCMDHVKCRRVGITGFPTLMTLNFDKRNPKMENKRIIGTHTIQEVKDYVDSVIAEVTFNTTGVWPPGYKSKEAKEKEEAEKKAEKEKNAGNSTDASKGQDDIVFPNVTEPAIWEESTLPMNQTTRIQDAASAFVFGLKQGVFMAGDVMEGDEFDALKNWLKVVSETFPGAINRKIIRPLYEKVKEKELLDFDTWDSTVKQWQEGSVAAFKSEEASYNFTNISVPEWQRLNNLFLGQGATYQACASYTCGQWTMFHMLTLNPPETGTRSADLMVSVVASIRRFMKHFFGCADCRDHFLKENTIEAVKKIQDAEDKPLVLRRWLWEQHNSVNKRLHHPIWPKPEICPTCGTEAAWELVEVDKWLRRTFAYYDVALPLKKVPVSIPAATAAALRKETDATITAAEAPKAFDEEKKKSATIAAEPKGGDDYTPKDAELGIKNAANSLDLVANTKAEPHDGLQGVSAPPVTLFAWYILPVAAVGGYLLFARSRSKPKAYRQIPRN